MLFDREAPQGREVPSKYSGHLSRGDRLCVTTPGGGGYGPRQDGDAAAADDDHSDGKADEGGAR
jgi:N-methylhydantoinase B/oxoprolinase/acetone carboxylase alpha subunit